ncbi:hypothetical protein BDZ89DRAFT_1133638 [Hymenopellis radicata]|nr:hypothetical protein BDZ89DRAFT_1133638 [Hymenopellis radicata]
MSIVYGAMPAESWSRIIGPGNNVDVAVQNRPMVLTNVALISDDYPGLASVLLEYDNIDGTRAQSCLCTLHPGQEDSASLYIPLGVNDTFTFCTSGRNPVQLYGHYLGMFRFSINSDKLPNKRSRDDDNRGSPDEERRTNVKKPRNDLKGKKTRN